MFNLFKKNLIEQDLYWQFDASVHFKPKINLVDYYKLSEFDFGYLIQEKLAHFVNRSKNVHNITISFSFAQKALFYWWILDSQVTNGGFIQFYYNNYEAYIPTIIKGMEYIGDTEMASLITRVHYVFKKNKKLFNKAKLSKDMWDNLYEEVEEMTKFDDLYFSIHYKTMNKLENYIRKFPDEVCVDENGDSFLNNQNEKIITYYSGTDKIKNAFLLEKGRINGEFFSFFENGNAKEELHFVNGKLSEVKKEYYQNGYLKYQVKKTENLNELEFMWFYENGVPQKLEHRKFDTNERLGEYKEWYENGNLAKEWFYITNYATKGLRFEYYDNGVLKSESEQNGDDYLLYNFWNKEGIQLVKNGNGTVIDDILLWDGSIETNQNQYKNYKLNGESKKYINGVLTQHAQYFNGQLNGEYKLFYTNGKVKEKIIFDNGNEISKKLYRKFLKPKIELKIYIRLLNEEYQKNETLILPDDNPKPINIIECEESFKAGIFLFEGYDDEASITYNYSVEIDKYGIVNKIRFSSADNVRIEEEVLTSINQLKFKPAFKNKLPINCFLYIQYKFNLTE